MKLPALTLALCASALFVGCSTPPDSGAPDVPPPVVVEKLEPSQMGSIMRIHALGDILLASQPSSEDFAQASQDGVKTVINLRLDAELGDFDEAGAVAANGLRYVHLPWNGAGGLTDAVFDETRELLNHAERPILLHCGSANRVGAVWIPWRVLDGGLSFDEALAEAETIGLKTPEFVVRAREYVESHE